MKKIDLSLYLITDKEGLSEEVFLNKIDAALKNGVTLLQLREKNATTYDYLNLAQKVKKVADKYAVPFIIDDRVDIALACAADGVHLGQEDMPIDVARKLLGKDKIIGATAKTIEQAQQAQLLGADYLGVGAIYPTTTKVKTVLTKVETLKDICANVAIPVAAIGGLNSENLAVLENSGIRGICVVSAIMKAEDSGETAKVLKQKAKQLIAD